FIFGKRETVSVLKGEVHSQVLTPNLMPSKLMLFGLYIACNAMGACSCFTLSYYSPVYSTFMMPFIRRHCPGTVQTKGYSPGLSWAVNTSVSRPCGSTSGVAIMTCVVLGS